MWCLILLYTLYMPKKWPLSYCSCVGRTGERGGGGAGGRSAGPEAYGGTHFTCFTGTNVQILTYWCCAIRVCSIYLLFPGTKVQILTQQALLGQQGPLPPPRTRRASAREQGTQFTCFTGTKVQILPQKASCAMRRASAREQGIQFTCFTGRKVQILPQLARCARRRSGRSIEV